MITLLTSIFLLLIIGGIIFSASIQGTKTFKNAKDSREQIEEKNEKDQIRAIINSVLNEKSTAIKKSELIYKVNNIYLGNKINEVSDKQILKSKILLKDLKTTKDLKDFVDETKLNENIIP